MNEAPQHHSFISYIVLKNFMNCKLFEFKPVMGVNMILAPNGCGKSTILVAVKMACGSKPTECGRGKKIDDYIRNDADKEEESSILVKIHVDDECVNGDNDGYKNHDNNCTISLFVDLRKGKYNLKYKTKQLKKEIEIYSFLKEEFKIDVNNLCQILPQEKVTAFLTDKQDKNLKNIEEIIKPDLYKTHSQLEKDIQTTSSEQQILTHLQSELELLEDKYARCKGQQELRNRQKAEEERIVFLKGVKSWRMYDEIKDGFRDILTEYNNLPSIEPILQKIEGFRRELNEIDKTITKYKQYHRNETIDSLRTLNRKRQNDILDIDDKLKNINDRIIFYENKIKGIERTINDEKKRIEFLENSELSSPPQEMVDELKSLKNQFKKCQTLEHQINNKMNDLKGENDKLTTLVNRIDRDINNLYYTQNSSLSADTSRLMDLVNNPNNRIRFNNKYYLPICRYISCRNNQDANLVKEVLSYYLLNGVLFLNDEDGYKTRNIVRSKNLKHLNVYTYTHQLPIKNINLEPLKQFHIFNTIDGLMEFDDEDESLRQFLATNSYTNSMLVADRGFNEKLFERYLMNLPPPPKQYQYQEEYQYAMNSRFIELNMMKIIVVYTPTHRYQFNRIRGGRFACGSSLRRNVNHNLIIPGLLNTKRKLYGNRDNYINRLESIKVEMNEIMQSSNENHEKKEVFKKKYDELYIQYIDIKNKQMRLQQLKSNMLKYENERHNYLQKKAEASRPELKRQSLKQLMNYEIEIFKNTKRMENYLLLDSIINDLERNKVGLHRSIKEEENNKAVYEETRKNITRRLTSVNNDLEDAYKKAQSLYKMKVKRLNLRDCPVKTQYLVDYTAPPEFFKVKGNVEEIQTNINQLQALIESIVYDEQAIEDFETVSRKRDEKKAEFEKLEGECDKHERDLRIGFQKWHNELTKIVKIMNEKFNKFLNLGYYGNNGSNNKYELAAVQLIPAVIDGNLPLTEYLKVMDNCQILIKAKLKSFERMRDITSHTLSGGERAFSVSLFLLSLRGVILSPFCFMDEINQGMDEEYEIDFFRILLSDPKPDTQYFIISPTLNMKLNELLCELSGKKLLPHMTCNIILNGDHVPNVNKNHHNDDDDDESSESESDNDNNDDGNTNGLLIVIPEGQLKQNPYFKERHSISPPKRRRSNNNNNNNEEEEVEDVVIDTYDNEDNEEVEEVEKPKKKRQKRILSTSDDDDEEEEPPVPAVQVPKQKQKLSKTSKRKQIIASDENDEDDDEEANNRNVSNSPSISDQDEVIEEEEEISKPKKRKHPQKKGPIVYRESITPRSKRNIIASDSDDSDITCVVASPVPASVHHSPAIVVDNYDENRLNGRSKRRRSSTRKSN